MATYEEKNMDTIQRGEAEAEAGAGPGADTGAAIEAQREEQTLSASNASSKNIELSAAPSDHSSTTVVPKGNADVEAAAPAPEDPESTRTTLQTAIIMASLCSGVFLAALDTTIVTTALPTISEYFQSDAGYTWIGSAYLLANAASTPSWGKFSDIWGRKPVLLFAAAIFFVGSLLAATSVSIGMLIVARAIQGVGGGGLIILTNICISDLFSMRSRGKYFGIVGMVWAFASATGPILGGVFTEKVSWRWCFYINLPITGAAFFILLFFLKLDNPKTPVWAGLKAVDWLGSLTIIGGTLMLLLGLEFGGVIYPWNSAMVICLIVFGIVTAGLFVLNEAKFARYPVMPIRLFKHRSNIASLGVCFFHGVVFVSGTYYLPLYFQAVLGATPLLSGVYLLPFALALSFCSGATGVFIKKTGKYLPAIWAGLIIMTLGWGLFIDLEATPVWYKLIIFEIIAGIGCGTNFQSPLIALQTKVAPQDIASATATFGFTRNLSTAISVVIGGVVFQNQMAKKTAALTLVLGADLATQLSGASAGASVGIVQSLPPAQQVVVRQAYFESLQTMWIMYTAFAAAGVIVGFCVGDQKLTREHKMTKTGLAAQEEMRKEEQEQKKASKELLRASKDIKRQQRNASPPVNEKAADAV